MRYQWLQRSILHPIINKRLRLLKGAIVWSTIMTALYIPFAAREPSNSRLFIYGLGGVIIVFALALYLAYQRYVVLSGIILCITQIIFTTFVGQPRLLLEGPSGMIYLVPVLIAGMVMGARAVVAFGVMSWLMLCFMPVIRNYPWTTKVIMPLFIMAAITGLIWLIIQSMEQTFKEILHQERITADHRRQAEIAERQAALITQFSHDVRGPLNNALAIIELLPSLTTPTEHTQAFQHLRSILVNARAYLQRRLAHVVHNMPNDTSDNLAISINLIDAIHKITEDHRKGRRQDIHIHPLASNQRLWTTIPFDVLESIIGNIIQNSLSIETVTSIDIDVFANSLNQDIGICVHDNGPGYPEAIISRGPQRGVSHRADGIGIGLIGVQTLLDIYEGTIRYDNNNGAKTIIYLPHTIFEDQP